MIANFPGSGEDEAPISGTVSVNNFPTTQNVSIDQAGSNNDVDVVSSVLPTGAATAAKQDTGNTSLASIDTKLTSPLSVNVGNFPSTQNVAVTSAIEIEIKNDSGNPLPVNGTVNVGNFPAVQSVSDNNGSLTVDSFEKTRLTYSAAVTGVVTATTPSDVFTLTGSGSKTVRITKINVSGASSVGTNATIIVVKRSSANSGGTSTTMTNVPHDSADAAGTATVRAYTANPTPGTLVGLVRATRVPCPAVGTPNITDSVIYEALRGAKELVVRGTSEVVAVNLNSTTVAGGNFHFYIEWTEE